MYPYVYIQDESDNRNWYLIIRELDTKLMTKAVEIWEDSIVKQMMNGRRGLTLDLIAKLKNEYIKNTFKWINDGNILLVNKQGGCMFLEDNHIVINEIICDSFPIDGGDYFNGILSPDGVFTPCDFGSHYKITQNIKDDNNEYITISQDKVTESFAIFISDTITEKQKSFLKEHLNNLSPDCIKILNQKEII